MKLPRIQLPAKPHYINLAQHTDFFALFQKIQRCFSTCFFCESLGEVSAAARYSIIGFAPLHIIRAKENILFFDGQEYRVDNPYEALRAIMPQDCLSRQYVGGLFGYMSYEAVNYLESGANVKIHPLFDQFLFGVYTDGLILDKATGQLSYFYYGENRADMIVALLKGVAAKMSAPAVLELGDTMNKERHRQAVLGVLEEIRAGRTFQCEVGFKSEYEINGSALPLYERLRETNPSPYMFYFQYGDLTLLGASPELLLKVSDGKIETVPLAGTIQRGADDEEDRRLARALLNDQKERAEHMMLVDLARNDVGRVARFGTVKIESLMDILKLTYVQHISSTVTGILRQDADMFEALKCLMPGGVLTGAPKIESMKIIDANEPEARGPYGGAVGYFGFNGDCVFTIPIRSLFIKGRYGYTQTCSGIVYDSDPDKEYEEIKNKLAGLRLALKSFL